MDTLTKINGGGVHFEHKEQFKREIFFNFKREIFSNSVF